MSALVNLFAAALFVWGVSAPADARSAKPVRSFKHHNPCPATGKSKGACPGFVVDHIVPLCAGGRDHPENMQWQTRAESFEKDKEERRQCRQFSSRREVGMDKVDVR